MLSSHTSPTGLPCTSARTSRPKRVILILKPLVASLIMFDSSRVKAHYHGHGLRRIPMSSDGAASLRGPVLGLPSSRVSPPVLAVPNSGYEDPHHPLRALVWPSDMVKNSGVASFVLLQTTEMPCRRALIQLPKQEPLPKEAS